MPGIHELTVAISETVCRNFQGNGGLPQSNTYCLLNPMREGCELQEVHVNHHLLMINRPPFLPAFAPNPKPGSASNLVGIRNSFRHQTSLDKTDGFKQNWPLAPEYIDQLAIKIVANNCGTTRRQTT